MSEIVEEQVLERTHLFCFRGKIGISDFESIGRDMEMHIEIAGARRVDYPVTATFGVEDAKIDIEIMIPVNKKIEAAGQYYYKEKIKIVNAVVARHRGNPTELQNTCNELNRYIENAKMVPITVGYSVPLTGNATNTSDSEIDVYIGISPNQL